MLNITSDVVTESTIYDRALSLVEKAAYDKHRAEITAIMAKMRLYDFPNCNRVVVESLGWRRKAQVEEFMLGFDVWVYAADALRRAKADARYDEVKGEPAKSCYPDNFLSNLVEAVKNGIERAHDDQIIDIVHSLLTLIQEVKVGLGRGRLMAVIDATA